MEQTSRVVVLGGASIDVKGRAHEALLSLTSNPGAVQLSIGGCARNTAENLARLGIETTLVSVVGADIIGQTILAHCTAVGVDCEHVLVSSDHHSGAYMALLDEEGELVVSIDDMDILGVLTSDYLEENKWLFYGADMVLIDGNLTEEAIAWLAALTREEGIPLCVDPTSVSLAEKFRPYLEDIDLFMPNMAEAEVFCVCDGTQRDQAISVARELVQQGVGTAIVTLGADGVAYASSDEIGSIPAFPIDDIVDPTGVGAALTAGVVFGLLNDVPLDEAVRLGASAAALTIQSNETVRSDLSLDLLYEQIMVF